MLLGEKESIFLYDLTPKYGPHSKSDPTCRSSQTTQAGQDGFKMKERHGKREKRGRKKEMEGGSERKY